MSHLSYSEAYEEVSKLFDLTRKGALHWTGRASTFTTRYGMYDVTISDIPHRCISMTNAVDIYDNYIYFEVGADQINSPLLILDELIKYLNAKYK